MALSHENLSIESDVWGSECVSNPLTGRSASSRLRFRSFRFVSCVRAGGRARRSCAGACGTLSSTLGLPGARLEVWSRAVGVNYLLAGVRVLKVFDSLLMPRTSQIAISPAGFKVLVAALCCSLLTGVRVPRLWVCCLLFFPDRRAGSKVLLRLPVVLC